MVRIKNRPGYVPVRNHRHVQSPQRLFLELASMPEMHFAVLVSSAPASLFAAIAQSNGHPKQSGGASRLLAIPQRTHHLLRRCLLGVAFYIPGMVAVPWEDNHEVNACVAAGQDGIEN